MVYALPKFFYFIKDLGESKGLTPTELHFKTKMSYSHISFLKKYCIEHKLVHYSIDKKSKILLTERGYKMFDLITQMFNMIDNKEDDVNVDSNKNVRVGDGTFVGESQGVMQKHSRTRVQDGSNSGESQYNDVGQFKQGNGSGLQRPQGDSKQSNNI